MVLLLVVVSLPEFCLLNVLLLQELFLLRGVVSLPPKVPLVVRRVVAVVDRLVTSSLNVLTCGRRMGEDLWVREGMALMGAVGGSEERLVSFEEGLVSGLVAR